MTFKPFFGKKEYIGKGRTNMLEKAIKIATKAHKGQKRKLNGLPYITHPLAVMQKLISYNYTDERLLSAAVLHDVIEDCGTYFEKKIRELDQEVFLMVMALTRYPDMSKEEYTQELSESDAQVQLIKAADIWHNTCSTLSEHYMRSKNKQLKRLERVVGTYVWMDAHSNVRAYA